MFNPHHMSHVRIQMSGVRCEQTCKMLGSWDPGSFCSTPSPPNMDPIQIPTFCRSLCEVLGVTCMYIYIYFFSQFFFYKMMELVGGGSVINGACLVYYFTVSAQIHLFSNLRELKWTFLSKLEDSKILLHQRVNPSQCETV